MGFPGGTSDKESACQCRRQETWVQSLGQGRDPGELGNPLQYCCLENAMGRETWGATVHVRDKESDITE